MDSTVSGVTRSRKRKQLSGTETHIGDDGGEVATQQEVIVLDDSNDGEESKKDNGVMEEFADSSISDSILIAAAEKSESCQSSPFVRSNNNTCKKIHMDMMDCKEHADSQSGSQALSNPSNVIKSSKDPNRGLYPRPSFKKDPSSSGAFVPASALHHGYKRRRFSGQNDSTGNFNTVLQPQTYRLSPKKQRTGPKLPYQNNSLDRYFSASQPSAGSTENISSTPPKTYSQGSPSSTPPLPRSPPSFMYSPIKQVAGSNLFTMGTADCVNSSNKLQDRVSKNLFNRQKGQPVPRKTSRSVKSKKPAPTFNRGNSFLYSNDPIPKSSSKPKDLYGLLGNGNLLPDENLSWKNINEFPYEILENILCRLPMMDLCLNVNRVCILWRDIIADEKVRI